MYYFDYVNGIEKCIRTSPLESSYQELISRFFEDELINTKIGGVVSKDFPQKSKKNHCTSYTLQMF